MDEVVPTAVNGLTVRAERILDDTFLVPAAVQFEDAIMNRARCR
jgi:hypothetical protein